MKGVYAIVDKETNKYYIGSSIDIKRRWYRHRSELRKNKHGNQFLQRIFNKRGEDNLFFLVLEQCEDIINKEQEYIDIMFLQDRCMNGRKTAGLGGTRRGHKNTEEHNRKISEAQKGKPRTHKKRTWTAEQRKAVSDFMKQRHKLGLVKTGGNQYKRASSEKET